MLIAISLGINALGNLEEVETAIKEFINLDAISSYVYLGHCFNCSVGIDTPVSVESDNYVYLGETLTVSYTG